MREKGMRKLLFGILGGLICKCGVTGCYPLVPAYFAALYLEEIKGWLVMGPFFFGMLFFIPLPTVIKYLVVVLLIAAFIRLMEWVGEGCRTWVAGIAAGILCILLSLSGNALELKMQAGIPIIFLEGILTAGATVLFRRGAHFTMELELRRRREERAEPVREEKLKAYAKSFSGLSEVFQAMSEKKNHFTPDELGQIQNEITGKLCANCSSCAVCWEKDTTPLYGIISNMIASVLRLGHPEKEDEKNLKKFCKRSKDMTEEAVRVFERASLNRAWYNRLLENRQVIAEQLDAMAYIMEDCANEAKLLDKEQAGKLSELRYLIRERGLLAEELHLYERMDGHYRLEAVLKSKNGGCIPVRIFAKAAGMALGRPFQATKGSRTFISKENSSFTFVEDTKYQNVQGIARVKKDGEQISGDNFSFQELENGEFIMSLSDGMGSGSAACKESELVLDLMERFLEAGFSIETAIRMMNSAMVMRGEQNLFSTIDLCAINLYTGGLRIYKIGAAATFLKRKDGVECILSTNLPVGAEQKIEIEKTQKQLESGDFLVMVTDGVLEYLHVPKPEETMREMIESIDANHPGTLAKKLMERVMLFTGGKAQDDMTILTTCIWEKNENEQKI